MTAHDDHDDRRERDADSQGDAAWLDELRAAWRQLPAPPPAREPADEDALTQRTVEWTRNAWQALPVPAAVVPMRGAVVRSPVWRRRSVAAAAALLIAVGVPLLVIALRRSDATAPDRSPDHAPVAEASPPGAPPTILAADDRCFELSSGPVRLYLFPDPPHEAPR